MRTALSANTTFYVNASTGSDSNTGLTSGSPWLTLQHARDTVQANYDLNGYAVTYSANGSFPAGVLANGPLVGQRSPNDESFVFDAGSVVTASASTNGIAMGALYGAQYSVSEPMFGNLTIRAYGSNGVGFAASAGGFINILTTTTIDCQGYALQTNWGGQIIANTLYIVNSMSAFIFASGGVVQLNPGNTLYIMGNPTYSKAFVWSYNGTVGADSLTVTPVGTVTGKRYLAELCGVIATGGGPNYFPGSVAGSVASGGQYI